MTYGSVCSGIEAATVAFKPLGWKCAFVAEMAQFPSSVLKHCYPEAPNYGDITKFQEWPDHSIDVLIGGTPCQSFSVAGLRAGLRDPRGNLALTFLAIADRYRPTWIVWENVPGVHSSWSDETVRPPTEEEARTLRERGLDPGEYEYAEQRNDFDCFLSGMEELGYGVATTILDAQFFNLAQRRERVFVIGHTGGQWQRAAAVLFDSTCLRGDSAPRRQEGKRVAPTIEGRAGRSGANNFATSGGLLEVAPTIPSRNTAGGGMGSDFEGSGGVIPIQEIGKRQSGTPMNGVGHGQPGDPMFTLQAAAVHGVAAPIPFDTTQITSKANRSHPEPGDPCHPVAAEAHVPAIAWTLQERDSKGSDSKGSDSSTKDGHLIPVAYRLSGNCGVVEQGDKTAALNCNTDPTQQIITLAVRGRGDESNLECRTDGTANAVLTPNGGRAGIGVGAIQRGMAVRRLTPKECERLQGFPDDYTKLTEQTADTPRYKALGNSFAVPVIRWLGERIQLVESIPC